MREIGEGDKLERIAARLKHLRGSLHSSESLLPSEEDLAGLVGPRGAPRLLLGTYSVQEVEEALNRFKILPALAGQGLRSLHISLDTSDASRHTFRLHEQDGGERLLVAESALRLDSFQTEAHFAAPLHGRRFRMLFILWLLMQNPRARFSPRRPALPGQVYPGLGIGRQVTQVYLAMARRLQCDGIVNSPEFGHTAVLYSRRYRFLDPEAEGRLIALRRDLAPLSLAEASWALHTGCVLLEGEPSRPYRWVPEDQVLPLAEPLLAHFRSREYVQAVKRAAKRHRFRLDAERFARMEPLNPDGSPHLPEAARQPEAERADLGADEE